MITTMDLHANFAEQTQDKFQEKKSGVLPFYGEYVFCGPLDFCAVFHAAWTVAKTLNQSAQSAIKSRTRSQPIVVDYYNLFLNYFFCIYALIFEDISSQLHYSSSRRGNNFKRLVSNLIIYLFVMSIVESIPIRRECYTCTSRKRQKKPDLTLSNVQSFYKGQILLNTAKILKGNKKNLKQYLRNQTLKSSGFTNKNKNKSKSYLNSIARTAETTPRQFTNYNFDLMTLNNQKQEPNTASKNNDQLLQTQSNFKHKMKMLTQNHCRRQFRKLINHQYNNRNIKGKITPNQELDNLSFRQSAFSKQLVSYQSEQNKKPKSLKPYNSNVSINSFQSTNLEKRMNQYMNTLIQKSQKDQLNILETVLTDRRDEQQEKIRAKQEKVMEKIRQKNMMFCKRIKMANRTRIIASKNQARQKQSISPKFRSIDISWRDVVQQNKDSELTKNILKMHNSNQFRLQNTNFSSNSFMQNNFLRSLINKKRFDLS